MTAMDVKNCAACKGEGEVSSYDGKPWSLWGAKPGGAVLSGRVKPVPCPACAPVLQTKSVDATPVAPVEEAPAPQPAVEEPVSTTQPRVADPFARAYGVSTPKEDS